MFYDLNVPRGDASPIELRKIIQEIHNRGYNAIAITTEINEEFLNVEIGKKRKHQVANGIPAPVDVAQFKDVPMKIYNRINIFVKDVASFQKVNRMKELKKYDLISYLPGSAVVLKTLTNHLDFDILAFNPTIQIPMLNFNRKIYGQFVQNEVYMEIPYAPCVTDSTCRKYTIHTAHVYHAIGKSENFIVTSGASNVHQIRTPYDVINLGILFGLNDEQAKSAIAHNCENLLIKSRTRRRGKSTMEITQEVIEI